MRRLEQRAEVIHRAVGRIDLLIRRDVIAVVLERRRIKREQPHRVGTQLMDVVERTGADQVYTVHGFTEDFARSLRRRGIRAWALEANEQLALAL